MNKQLSINTKSFLITGILVMLASVVFPALSYFHFKSIFLLDPGLWKWKPGDAVLAMPVEWIIITLVGNFIMALIFVFVYAVMHKNILASGAKKGLWFGFLMWLIGVVIPVFSMYVLINISNAIFLFLLIQGLVEYLLYGVICAMFYRERQLQNS